MVEAVDSKRKRVSIEQGDVADEVGENCGKDHLARERTCKNMLHSLVAALAVLGVRQSDMSTCTFRL